MGKKKNLSVKQICSILSLASAAIGIIVCAIPAFCVLTVAIIPYLHVLDRIGGTGTIITKVGGTVAGLVLIYLWIVYLIVKRCNYRKFMGFGIAMILAAPLCVLINYSLSLTLTPEAAAFDVWDVLDIVILLAGGAALIGFDFILKKKGK